jgi:hypothetical protein
MSKEDGFDILKKIIEKRSPQHEPTGTFNYMKQTKMEAIDLIPTLRNVASDLSDIAQRLEDGEKDMQEAYEDATLACEYITNDEPHL